MTGSIALDVVIGLVFIFLLYSLLATIIQEIIANILGLRARNLKHAISRMLQDGPKKQKNILSQEKSDNREKLNRNFAREKTSLLEDFYQQPVITQLASGNYFSKPSYLNESDFAQALIEILKTKGEKLLEDGIKKDKEDIQNIEAALNKIKNDDELDLSGVLHEALRSKERRILGNEDNQEIADIDKLWAAIADGTNDIDTQTKEHLNMLLENAQNDMVKFRASLESWFNHTMERASGWYKKTIQFTLVIIGFIMAMMFDANTIEITRLLSTDKEAREALVNMATNYVEENPELLKYLENDNKADEEVEKNGEDEIDNSSEQPNSDNMETEDSINANSGSDSDENKEASKQEDSTKSLSEETTKDEFESKLDELLEIKAELESDIEDAHNILGFRPIDNVPVKEKPEGYKLKPTQKELINIEENKTYVLDFPNALLANKTYEYYKLDNRFVDDEEVAYADFDYLGYIYDNFWSNFWGYLITALAISLGAPFWFDLLSKLIRIRGSLQSQAKTTSNTSTGSTNNRSVNQRVG